MLDYSSYFDLLFDYLWPVSHPRAALAHLISKMKGKRIDKTVKVVGWGSW
jgi:hypothetical protein